MVSMHFFVKVWTVRMGKKEGLSNTVKRKVHDVYVKDKTDVKLLGSRPWMCFPYVLFVGADHLYNLFPFVEHFWAYPKPSWRPSWFIHENVKAFPLDYLENKFKLHYSCQSTNISPQRFGKPMNRSIVAKEHKCAICCKSYRCVCLLGYFFNFLVCVCVCLSLACQAAHLPNILWQNKVRVEWAQLACAVEAHGSTPRAPHDCWWHVLHDQVRACN